ncbi:bifunctional UDP-N-acetylglucosamine diphosphorylase/glucosamine-1-phosphate N-acetyltransferase GlmU [Thermoflexus sp.]|uniref:bifunctional UDP-N-acetylglucosamine diphosphorylase/glucosamine-1-phosphate N-acetyltransferase GlmU n=1 Tax=Thermoflexus sp. TaxID=1969742 RepID=UPI0035E42459
MTWTAVILAAGLSTRFKSERPKVVHPLAGRPMIQHVLKSLRAAGCPHPPVVVIGLNASAVREAAGPDVRFAVQPEPRGTGDAVRWAEPILRGEVPHILITYADLPLVRPETFRRLIETHQATGATLTFLTVHRADPAGYGRVVRDPAGRALRIVEEAEANPEEREISEINVGVYVVREPWLWVALSRLQPSPAKGEIYLTDLVALAAAEGARIETVALEDPEEALGINTRVQLAEAERILRRRINTRWMLEGVTLLDPERVYIGAEVSIGPDTVIYPDTYIEGETRIGRRCRIGPNTILRDAVVGDECVVEASVVEGAVLADRVHVGPFARLRPGTRLAEDVHVGNFAEIKNSAVGPRTRMHHFGYLGDATVGADVNIGAGTVTCNFDGVRKHPTIIEDEAFIGSDTMLVAPVRVGRRAKTGAGSVVTRDVPPETLVYGVPARPRSPSQDVGDASGAD